MTIDDVKNVALPKWPCLLVKGDKITSDQAKEVIFKTAHLPLWSNEREFESKVNKILYNHEGSRWDLKYEDTEPINNSLGVLDLNYLANYQIASSWVGGAHGWCDWNGNIECNTYNIGKWPNTEEIYNDLVLIADTFNFLNFRCQILNKECNEDGESIVLLEFEINGGLVNILPPDIPMLEEENVFNHLLFRNELGCTIEQFEDAYNYVKKVNNERTIKKS